MVSHSVAPDRLRTWSARTTFCGVPAIRISAEHGTPTAATIAARPVNEGRVGVAPDALLASAMVIEGGNLQARVLGGLDWARQPRAHDDFAIEQ